MRRPERLPRVDEEYAPKHQTFDEFYQAEYRQLVGLGYVLCGSRFVAEDLVQDAFAEAHKRWEVVSFYENPTAWLRRVLVNKATSRGRRLTAEAKMLTKIGNRRTPELEVSEPTSEIWAAVRALPKRQSQVIALRYWDDLGIEEIASILDCKPETVKTHLKRGRSKLAHLLDDSASETDV